MAIVTFHSGPLHALAVPINAALFLRFSNSFLRLNDEDPKEKQHIDKMRAFLAQGGELASVVTEISVEEAAGISETQKKKASAAAVQGPITAAILKGTERTAPILPAELRGSEEAGSGTDGGGISTDELTAMLNIGDSDDSPA